MGCLGDWPPGGGEGLAGGWRGGIGSALSVAAANGHLDVVQVLLAVEPDVRAAGNLKQADTKAPENRAAMEANAKGKALIYATEYGYHEVVRALLAAGARVNTKREGSDQTALHLALLKRYGEIALTLIDAGANINSRIPNYPDTPLMRASADGDLEVVRALLAAGAPVITGRGDFYGTGSEEFARDLALSKAASNGHLEIVQVLLARLSDLKAIGEEALAHKFAERAKMGVPFPNLDTLSGERDYQCMSELTWGEVSGFISRAKWAALIGAVSNGHLEVVRALLAAGADPNAKGRGGPTPLAVAKNPEVKALLVQAGAQS